MSDYYGRSAAAAPKGPPSFNNNNNSNNANMDAGKIFVGGLSWQTTEESLRWHFEQYGPVANVDVMRDRNTGDPRGFAFVVFKDPDTVDVVMQAGAHEINHKVVDVKRAQARGVAPPSIHRGDEDSSVSVVGTKGGTGNYGGGSGGFGESGRTGNNDFRQQQQQQQTITPEQRGNKVFVGGIPPFMDQNGLRQLFSEFGTVVDAIVMMDANTQRSRCFGFVTFANDGQPSAQRAIAAQPLSVQGRNVEVKLAMPRSDAQPAPQRGGLRAGAVDNTNNAYSGLAVAYGRNGWKAGYGSRAFGQAGWAVEGWAPGEAKHEESGFSFDLLPSSLRYGSNNDDKRYDDEPPSKRVKSEY